MAEIPIAVRGAVATDIPLLTNAWLKSYREGYMPSAVSNTVYFAEHHKLLEEIIPRCETVVACNGEDPDQVFGFVTWELYDNIALIHYLYVKHVYRKLGVGTRLVRLVLAPDGVAKDVILTTHLTSPVKAMMKRGDYAGPTIVYNPYMLFQRPEAQ